MNDREILALMAKLISGGTASSGLAESYVGSPVIVRCRDAGVHFGTLEAQRGREARLSNSRRLWQWKAKREHTLSAVAIHGIESSGSKLSPVVPIIALQEICEVIPVLPGALASLTEQAAHAE